MKRNKGYTLLEILIAVAMVAILGSLLAPLGSAFTKSHQRQKEINDIDLELSKVIDLIKKDIRSAQSDGVTGHTAIIEPVSSLTATSSALTLSVAEYTGNVKSYKYIRFHYDSTEKELKIDTQNFYPTNLNTELSGGDKIMSKVETVEFKYSENIVTIYFKVQSGDYSREIRDAAVTRIDYKL